MQQSEVQRLESDLLVIRRAGRFDKPYAAEDVPLHVLIAACGLAISIGSWLSAHDRAIALVCFIPVVFAMARITKRRRQGQADRPMLWKEWRNSLLATVVVAPATLVWMIWKLQQSGTPTWVTGASAVFFIGVGCLVLGLLDSDRRAYIASGLSLMCLGLAIPVIRPNDIAVATGLAVALYGASGAIILKWQLRTEEAHS